MVGWLAVFPFVQKRCKNYFENLTSKYIIKNSQPKLPDFFLFQLRTLNTFIHMYHHTPKVFIVLFSKV